MVVSGITAVQSGTTSVFNGTQNNTILDIRVTATGTCSPKVITLFNLDTNGQNGTGTNNPTTNITRATIYYTGISGTFNTSTVFGYVDIPNGAFTISGSQTLSSGGGTYHFWLVYDVATLPNYGERIDASCYSAVISGSTTALTAQSPTGSRLIAQEGHYYSVTSGNWNDNSKWSNIDGGTSCSCQPNGSGTVHIKNGHKITVNSNRIVDDVIIDSGGELTGGNTLNVTNNMVINGTGIMTPGTNWTIDGNLTINGTGASTINGILTVAQKLTIASTASLSLIGGGGKDLVVQGQLTVNGTLNLYTRSIYFNNALSQELNGTGSITGSGSILHTAGVLDILSGSVLTIAPIFSIANGLTVNNFGNVTINNNLTGGNGTSTWINKINSTLSINGALLATGTLTASAKGNTVNYSSASTQTIKTTTGYYNLTLSNAGIKTLAADMIINNNLLISGTASFDVSASNRAVTILGNWTVTSSAADPFVSRSGTVTFAGASTTPQYITSAQSGGEEFYTLAINSSGYGVYLSNDVKVTQQLNLVGGNIHLHGKVLSVERPNPTAIVVTDGAVMSEMSDVSAKLKWNIGSVAGTYTFPLVSSGGNTLPFVLQLVSGDIGYLSVASYSTAESNTYPPSVTNANHYHMIKRFWQIDKTGGAVNCTATFAFDENEDPIFGDSEILMQRWNSVTSSWDAPLPGQTYNADNRTVTVPGITQFSPWGGSGSGSALPIELLNFSGKLNDNGVVLDWATALEINNEIFLIERSADGLEYETIGTVAGAGSSTEQIDYQLIDHNPMEGINYYKLVQIDFDGEHTESKSISILNKTKYIKEPTFNVYPNPVKSDQFQVAFEANGTSDKALIQIVDMQGRILHSLTVPIIDNGIYLDLPLPQSTYIFNLQYEGASFSKRIERQ